MIYVAQSGAGVPFRFIPFWPGPNGIALPLPLTVAFAHTDTYGHIRTHWEMHNETLGALVERTWTVSRTPIAANTHTHGYCWLTNI